MKIILSPAKKMIVDTDNLKGKVFFLGRIPRWS